MTPNARNMSAFLLLLAGPAVAAACGAGEPARSAATALERAASAVTANGLLAHIEVLASDEFEGRAPATRGEELTVAYLTEAFQRMGLEPGSPDGGFAQTVPLIGFRAEPSLTLRAGDWAAWPRFPDEFVAISRRFEPLTVLDGSELVFVGYGVVAPEYDWDDFEDVDVTGKTVVMLVNDPPVPHPSDRDRLDPDVFRGEAMTYYGRWTYKYEIAAEQGAAAAIIVHETGPAGYPFDVISSSRSRENFDIRGSGATPYRLAAEAWITEPTARALLAAAGHDFDELKRAAATREFRPVELGATADFRIRTTTRQVESRNVIALLPGSHPERRDEYVVYTAHWDHLGKDESREGNQVFNGAIDNASGTAGLLKVARAFTELPEPPDRSIVFLAVTAEEMGLLGARYYAENPIYPLERTLANINIDGLNPWGRTRDIVVIGHGGTTLEDVLAEAASRRGRVVAPDPEPEKGYFYRSDHFEFAKQGVPAIFTGSGTEYIGRPEGWGQAKRDEYTANDYHDVTDEVKPDWDLSGAAEDVRLLFELGYRVARADRWPEWKPGAEFRARREEMLRAAAAAAGT